MEVKLVVVGGKNQGREILIPGPQFIIGRGESCQLRPASDRISRKHCALLIHEGRALIRDLKSTNGTFVNDERISGDRELKNGDNLKVGGALEFEVQLSVSVGGKKKPKVHSIQEAAARTVQNAKSDDLDIADWLEDIDSQTPDPNPLLDLKLKNTATSDRSLADTTTIFIPQNPGEPKPKEPEKKPPQKLVGQFERSKKPTSDNSQAAANDMLRQFFGRKR